MISQPLTAQRLALAAASSVTFAACDLIQIAHEGDVSPDRNFETETLPQLADGLKMAIEAAQLLGVGPADAEGIELLGQLQGALTRFLEGWA